jgi:FAD/FMN-containing dehydrogenase
MSNEQSQHEPITFDTGHLEALRTRLRGSAILPGDEGYDKARQTWDVKTFDQHPAIVVLPANATDVQSAVIFARQHKLPVAVQGGGHGHPHPADNALLINFANMTDVQIDAEAATARIEPGVLFKMLVEAAHAHGLAPLNGFAASVGVVGYMLGGGLGWLARQYGSGAGSIRSVELVTADGSLLHVNASSHPDLFWGVRGGGGNFGIVTSLECALYPVNEIFAGQVVYPVEQGKDVLNAYLKWTQTLPDELTSALRITHFPPSPDLPPALRGKSVIVVMASYNGEATKGEALFSPMRKLGTVLLDTFAVIPYSQVATIANDPDDAPPFFLYNERRAFQNLAPKDIDTLLNIAGNRASGIFQTEIRQLGGVLARQSEDAMAFNCRHASFYLDIQATAPTLEQLAEGKRSTEALMQALRPDILEETFINFLDAGNVGPYLTQAAYTPANYQRLRALKDKYDAGDVFRFNHNITPSSLRG